MKVSRLMMVTLLFLGVKSMQAQMKKDSIPKPSIRYVVGGGIGFTPQYEGAKDVLLIPALTLSANWSTGQYIRLAGLGINANLLSHKKWEFGPRLGFKLPRNEDIVDHTQVAAMEDLDFALSLGIFSRYKFGKGFDIEGSYTHDISGVHEGGLAQLELGYSLRKKRFIHRFAVNTSLATEHYLNTYFGVGQQNVGGSQFEQYQLNGGIKDVGTSLTSIYVINRKWMLIGRLGYKMLIGDVADSPIVLSGTESQLSGGLAITYSF